MIGYGNTLRCDDGVGPRVAEAIAGMNLPGVRAIGCHQLTPELAAEMAHAAKVIFVDASVESGCDIQVRELRPVEGPGIMAHTGDPGTLLALCRRLFGTCPEAWQIAIPVENLEFGEQLSELARRGIERAVARILTFCPGK